MENSNDIKLFTGVLKTAILHSQYNAAKSVNSELVQLYFLLGAAISKKVKQANWGDKVLETISAELQKELKGLKGFSHQNLKKMKLFYEAYPFMLADCKLANEIIQLDNNDTHIIDSPVKNQTKQDISSTLSNQTGISISSTVSNQFKSAFWQISFSNHFSITTAEKELDSRVYYIEQTNHNSWSNRVLKNHLKNKIYQQNKLNNNFGKTLANIEPSKAIAQFKDEYLLDFLNIDDSDNERVIEDKIVQNIKDFILQMGTGFSFIGNQYRLAVEDDEFFIDLLFFNRNLQSLVAIELKRAKFKPEHLGQLSFYLNVLDDQIKLEHENPSIGIVLCKEKSNTVVEYALRNNHQPMGVATFKTKLEMPENMKNILPSVEELKQILMND
ncbi:MAG: PDDEXK nuclease domain-containing protein [Bacteroidales bacterium]|nr:PDDEXK nuclease domain-containing protein [Bacteroidales bacterium]